MVTQKVFIVMVLALFKTRKALGAKRFTSVIWPLVTFRVNFFSKVSTSGHSGSIGTGLMSLVQGPSHLRRAERVTQTNKHFRISIDRKHGIRHSNPQFFLNPLLNQYYSAKRIANMVSHPKYLASAYFVVRQYLVRPLKNI